MKHRPDITYLRKYLNGELDDRAMYELERQAEDDPMLMDMLRGIESATAEVHAANLDDIAARLHQRLDMANKTVKHVKPWKAWAIAASLLLFASIAGFWILRQPKEILLSQKAPSPSEQPAQKPPVPQPPAEKEVKKQPARKPVSVRRKEELLADLEETEKAKNSRPDCTRMLSEPRLTENRFTMPPAASAPKSFSKTDTLSPPTVSEKLAGRVAGITVRKTSSARDRRSNYIRGVIRDSEANEPLEGAQVTLKNGQKGAVSDKNGRFVLKDPTLGEDTLQIRQVGYETKELQLSAESGANDLLIAMSPSTASLDEVVVTAMGKKTKALRKAEPAMGWKAYKKYLNEKTSATGLSGKVTLAFNLDVKGVPIHIRVLKSDDQALEQPAIQLLKDGPAWTAGTEEGLQELIHLNISF